MNIDDTNIIFLTGFMGSGKSTIGPILANTLGYRFIDLDHCIEEQTSRTVAKIFAEQGETAFRVLETSTLRSLVSYPKMVISLGGGTLLTEENRCLVRENGILIYLKTDVEQIVLRMKNKTDRPLLRGPNGEQLPEQELRARIQQLVNEREKYYAMADLIVSTTHRKVGASVDEIVQKIRHHTI
jgi:shikimate kinase